MTDESYRKALEDAQEEAQKLMFQRVDIERRLAQLKTTVAALSGLLGEAPSGDETTDFGDMGITEAIRQVLRDTVSATPNDIKGSLQDAGYDLRKYANPSAVIHNTLKRLEAQGEVAVVRTVGSVAVYALTVIRPMSNLATFAELMGKGIISKGEGGSK